MKHLLKPLAAAVLCALHFNVSAGIFPKSAHKKKLNKKALASLVTAHHHNANAVAAAPNLTLFEQASLAAGYGTLGATATLAPKQPTGKQYVFLYAENRNCAHGNTAVFSTIIEVDAAEWAMNQEEKIENFAINLQKSYPQYSFEIGAESVAGIFGSKQEADAYREKCISAKQALQFQVTEFQLSE